MICPTVLLSTLFHQDKISLICPGARIIPHRAVMSCLCPQSTIMNMHMTLSKILCGHWHDCASKPSYPQGHLSGIHLDTGFVDHFTYTKRNNIGALKGHRKL